MNAFLSLITILPLTIVTLSAEETQRPIIDKDKNWTPLNSIFKNEVIPAKTLDKIRKALKPLITIKQHPSGFSKIEDVTFEWINIAGIHTRRSVSEDLFLFPYLDTNIDGNDWRRGIALIRGSNISYTWNLNE